MFPKFPYMRAKRIKGVTSYLRHFSVRMCSVCPACVDDVGATWRCYWKRRLEISLLIYTQKKDRKVINNNINDGRRV